jgi:excisionase family DNA binding protein
MIEILSAEDVATLLKCSVRTVEDHAREGRLPGAKFGDGWIFSRALLIEAVETIIREQARKPKPARKLKAVKLQPVKSGRAKHLPGLSALPDDVQAAVQS